MGFPNTPSSYADVERALQEFKDYVVKLPPIDSYPESPVGYPALDMTQFTRAKTAMDTLPACEVAKAPQFFGRDLRRWIESLQIEYAQTLSLAAEKMKWPETYVKGVLKNALPGVDVDVLLQKAGAPQSVSNEKASESVSNLPESAAQPNFSFAGGNPQKAQVVKPHNEPVNDGVMALLRRLVR